MHLTTTNIRKLVETTAEDMCDTGKIGAVERKAVSNINGHSSETCQKYYIKKARKHDAQHGQKMFDIIEQERQVKNNPIMSDNWWADEDSIYGNITSLHSESQHEHENKSVSTGMSRQNNGHNSQSLVQSKQHFQSPPRHQQRTEMCWGEDHPEFNSPKSRIGWSKDEMDYIRNWKHENEFRYPKKLASKLLAHIRNDEYAHKIFHSNHILDSARIRHGLRVINLDDEHDEWA